MNPFDSVVSQNYADELEAAITGMDTDWEMFANELDNEFNYPQPCDHEWTDSGVPGGSCWCKKCDVDFYEWDAQRREEESIIS